MGQCGNPLCICWHTDAIYQSENGHTGIIVDPDKLEKTHNWAYELPGFIYLKLWVSSGLAGPTLAPCVSRMGPMPTTKHWTVLPWSRTMPMWTSHEDKVGFLRFICLKIKVQPHQAIRRPVAWCDHGKSTAINPHGLFTRPYDTRGNPFAYHGINITRPFCYLRGKCSFLLI